MKRQNWGKSQIWYPKKIAYPSTLKQLQECLIFARENRLKIRIAGALHSLNDLCITDEFQLHTEKLDKILWIDKEKNTVKVQGGIKIQKLLEALAKEGLTLPNQGYITAQTIGGAVSTATHGSGNTGTFSSFVEEIELVDAKGNLRTLSVNKDPHLFSAAVVSLGCLGVLYTLTLRCVPLPKLQLTKIRTTLEETLEQLSSLRKTYPYFQFSIDPYSDEVIQWRYQLTDQPISNRLGYFFNWLLVKAMAVSSFDIFPMPWWVIPSTIKLYLAASPIKSCVDFSHRLLSPADEGHYIEQEIAVPLDQFKPALAKVREIIEKFSRQKKRYVAILLIRFADADPYGYLSPAFGRNTAYISLISLNKKGYRELFHEIEEALYPFSGRPHWGKVNFLNRERILSLYGDQYIKFSQARKILDPEKLFTNTPMDIYFPND